MYCIDADCALTYLMSKAANNLYITSFPVEEDAFDNCGYVPFPNWAYAPDGKIHLISPNEKARNQRNAFSSRRITQILSKGSFVALNKDVAIPSPECCYLLLAKKLPLPSLIKVGMLLCSNFSFDDIGDIDERRQSLSSVKKLKKYIDDNAGVYGVRNARLALDYIIDGAASPPEIDSSIILILKPLRGGYSFARPELNGQITLRSDIARSLGHRACYCDLLWRKQKCAIEYTSKQYHEGYEKQARDEIRRSAIENMGYRVFFLTKTQLYSQAAFDGFVRLVRQHMGMRGQANTQKLSAARYSLRQELLYNASWILRRACRNQQGDR